MTISSETRKAGPTPGNGVAIAFPFAFKVFSATDLSVILNTVATGVQQTLVLNAATGYTVALNADQNANPGGTVTYNPSGVPMPATQTLTIGSVVPKTQTTHLINGGAFLPANIEDMVDRVTIEAQQLEEKLSRSIKFPIVDVALASELPTAALRANKWFSFDSAGQPAVTDAQSAGGTSATATGFVTARLLADRFSDGPCPQDAGALGDGVTVDRVPVNTALVVSDTLVGRRNSTYLISKIGNTGSLALAVGTQLLGGTYKDTGDIAEFAYTPANSNGVRVNSATLICGRGIAFHENRANCQSTTLDTVGVAAGGTAVLSNVNAQNSKNFRVKGGVLSAIYGDVVSFNHPGAAGAYGTNFNYGVSDAVLTAGALQATVTGTANNGGGLVRLAVTTTANLITGDVVTVYGVTGTVEANGTWTCNVIDATHIDLVGTAFVNAFVAGGSVCSGGFAVQVSGTRGWLDANNFVPFAAQEAAHVEHSQQCGVITGKVAPDCKKEFAKILPNLAADPIASPVVITNSNAKHGGNKTGLAAVYLVNNPEGHLTGCVVGGNVFDGWENGVKSATAGAHAVSGNTFLNMTVAQNAGLSSRQTGDNVLKSCVTGADVGANARVGHQTWATAPTNLSVHTDGRAISGTQDGHDFPISYTHPGGGAQSFAIPQVICDAKSRFNMIVTVTVDNGATGFYFSQQITWDGAVLTPIPNTALLDQAGGYSVPSFSVVAGALNLVMTKAGAVAGLAGSVCFGKQTYYRRQT